MAKTITFVCSCGLFLAAFGAAESNVALVGDRLTLDALLWSTAHWWQFEAGGVRSDDRVFERVVALVGLTGRISSVASVRTYFDIGDYWGGPALDMYVNLRWRSGFELRVGQFLLPLGMDAATDYGRQKLIYGSFVTGYAKPGGPRDIGAMGSWQHSGLSMSAAVVNGSGINTGDDNQRKDVCGRIAVEPLPSLGAVFAVRGYFGWPGQTEVVWRSLALEAALKRGKLALQAESQNHRSPDTRNNTSYLQAAWDGGPLEPVARLDLVMPQGKRLEFQITGGLNLQPVRDHLKVMLDYSYRRDYQDNWSVSGFVIRLQAEI